MSVLIPAEIKPTGSAYKKWLYVITKVLTNIAFLLCQRQYSYCGTTATGKAESVPCGGVKAGFGWTSSIFQGSLKKKSKQIHIKQQHIDYVNSQCCPSPHFHHPWGKQRLCSVLPGVQTLLKSAFHTTQHIRWHIHLNLFKINKKNNNPTYCLFSFKLILTPEKRAMNKLNGWCVKSALIFIQIIWAQRKQPYWPLIEASSRIPQQSLLVSKSICTPLTAAAESQVQRDGINLQSKGRTFTLICDTILVWDQMQDLCFQRGPLCLSRHSFSHGWAKTATGLGWCCIPLDNAEARQRCTLSTGDAETRLQWQSGSHPLVTVFHCEIWMTLTHHCENTPGMERCQAHWSGRRFRNSKATPQPERTKSPLLLFWLDFV